MTRSAACPTKAEALDRVEPCRDGLEILLVENQLAHTVDIFLSDGCRDVLAQVGTDKLTCQKGEDVECGQHADASHDAVAVGRRESLAVGLEEHAPVNNVA